MKGIFLIIFSAVIFSSCKTELVTVYPECKSDSDAITDLVLIPWTCGGEAVTLNWPNHPKANLFSHNLQTETIVAEGLPSACGYRAYVQLYDLCAQEVLSETRDMTGKGEYTTLIGTTEEGFTRWLKLVRKYTRRLLKKKINFVIFLGNEDEEQ